MPPRTAPGAGSDARVDGDRPGRRLPALRLPARRASSGSPAASSTTSAASCSRSRARPAAVERVPARGCRPRRRRCAAVESVAIGPRSRGERGFTDRASRGAGRAAAPWSRRTWRPAPTASPSSSTRPTAATATRSSTAPTAGRGSRSSRGVPYDRPATTMAGFEMCAALPRRVRGPARPPLPRPAQRLPGLRPAGPARRPRGRRGRPRATATRSTRAASAAARGRILAVKGIGGYHLACRADDEAAVAELRARKHREDKPFALMAADLDAARELVELTAAEEAAARRPSAPIVIARRRAGRRGRSARRARVPGPRGDAALLAAPPPARSPTSGSRW